MKKWIFISVMALSAIFCNLTEPKSTPILPTQDVDSASTLIAAASATAKAQATPTPGSSVHEMGNVSGTLTYPADAIPPMRLAAFDVSTGQVSYIDTTAGQSTYTLALPMGTYHIVAYSIEGNGFPGGIASGYTRAVLCGLAPECADHALIDVIVTTGSTLAEINPADAYAPEGTFPPMPGQ